VYTRDDEGNATYNGATVATATFNYNGLTVTQTSVRTSKNAQGQQQSTPSLITTKTSNPLRQLVEVKDALNGTLRKRYDAFGNVLETQDAQDNRVKTVFDFPHGRRKTQLSDPNAGTWNYRYNALGELTGQQSPNQTASAIWTTFSYDVLGRMTQRVEPTDYNTTWTYDNCNKGVGKLCNVATDNSQSKSITYDSLGRPASITQAITNGPSFTAGTAYDSKGRVATYTYPTGIALTYVYTPLGYLSEIQRASASVWKLGSANAWGKPQSFDLGGSTAQNTRLSYDAVTG